MSFCVALMTTRHPIAEQGWVVPSNECVIFRGPCGLTIVCVRDSDGEIDDSPSIG